MNFNDKSELMYFDSHQKKKSSIPENVKHISSQLLTTHLFF